MVGPLYGLGAQQQIPLTSNSQQSQAAAQQQQKVDQDKQAAPNEIQRQGIASAESQSAEGANQGFNTLSAEQLAEASERGRGALLDLVV